MFSTVYLYIYISLSLSLSVSVLGQPHLFFLVGCTCHKIWEAWQARRGEETSSRLCGEPELWDPPHSCWRKWFFAAVHDQEWHQATWIFIYIIIYIYVYIPLQFGNAKLFSWFYLQNYSNLQYLEGDHLPSPQAFDIPIIGWFSHCVAHIIHIYVYMYMHIYIYVNMIV